MKSVLMTSVPKYDLSGPPAAIGVLQGVFKSHGWETSILDFNSHLHKNLTEKEWLELESWLTFLQQDIDTKLKQKILNLWDKAIAEKMPRSCEYVLMSVFSYWSIYIARLIIEHENKKLKPYKLIVGGNGVSSKFPDTNQYFKDWNEQHKYIEHLILGEGESPIANIITKGKVTYNDNDLDSYPFPTYGGFDFTNYQEKKVYITGSRGCVRKCTFCDIYNIWPKFRYRSAKSLVEEIKKHYYETGVKIFDFTDSLINGSISNFYKFNSLLAEEKEKNKEFKDIQYIGQYICRPKNQMPPSHYEAMHYAGAKQLTVGIEHFSNAVRTHMLKKFSNDDIDYHFEQCAYWNIPNVILMIVGYPTETSKDHMENVKAIFKYKKYAQMGIIELLRWGITMSFLPDTPITSPKSIKELGIKFNTSKETDVSGSANREYVHAWPYTWTADINPDLNLKERLRRRLELHKLSVEMEYPMPRVDEELTTLLEISKTLVK